MSLVEMISRARRDNQTEQHGSEDRQMLDLVAQFGLDFGASVYEDLQLKPVMLRDPEYVDHAALEVWEGSLVAYIYYSSGSWQVKRNVNCEAHSVRFQGALTGHARMQALLLKLGYIWGV